MILTLEQYIKLGEIPEAEDFMIFSSQELDALAEKLGINVESWSLSGYYLPFLDIPTKSITINNSIVATRINDLIVWWEI